MNWFKQLWKGFTEPAPDVRGTAERPFIRRTVARSESLANFSIRAQKVLALAGEEAKRLNHNFVGSEHLLLGIIKLGQGTAVNILNKMGLNLKTVQEEVEKQVGTGPDEKIIGSVPYTPRVKKVIALAQKEAKQLNHTFVGTEHLLLGLLREVDCVAAKVLASLGVELEKARCEILRELDPNHKPEGAVSQTAKKISEPASSRGKSTNPMDYLTPRAHQAFCLARKEARSFKHHHVGTEHLLVGLVWLGQGVAVNILAKAGLNLDTIRCQLKKTEDTSSDQEAFQITGHSEGIKKVMAIAQREATQMGHTYIGTEHLLLGLLQADDEAAAKIMRGLGVDLQQMRNEILRELNPLF